MRVQGTAWKEALLLASAPFEHGIPSDPHQARIRLPDGSVVPGADVQSVNQVFITQAGNRVRIEAELMVSADLPWVRLTMERGR